ncbi:MAG TPA: SAM-dependent chlorinase/fluorinase [Terriglobales bacterium]|nr:SAM-dependent chlorinase/fluorinase [Terriglobales bacterium]
MSAIVTFTTDFGTEDHYAGTMKGVVLNINPEAQVIDICHQVPAYDVLEGALTIAQAYRYFPAGTVHVVVVDPGVGSLRRAIFADTGQHRFVAPDNGVLSFVIDREPHVTVRHITNQSYFLRPVSNTFHGRDIFAPVAAHLSLGVSGEDVGPEISDHKHLDLPTLRKVGTQTIEGAVLKVDKFGNVVTNVTPGDFAEMLGTGAPLRVRIGSAEITELRHSYAGAKRGELFAIIGSMGFLEIAVNQDSAAALLQVKPGDQVEVTTRG